jgi:molecular chaperone HscB
MGSIPASTTEREGANRSPQETIACWQCGARFAPELFCPACDAIQPLPEEADYFQVLGLPGRLLVDVEALQQRYYELHRRLHPDLYQTAAQPARVASLRNTAAVNRAYCTLRDPVDRGLYWLTVQGESVGAGNHRVPPELAELVFEIQEQLEELRAARRTGGAIEPLRSDVAAAHEALQQRDASLLQQLHENFARWDAGSEEPARLRQDLKATLAAISYVRTLIRNVEKELES